MNAARGAWARIDGVLQAAPAPRFGAGTDWQPAPIPARGADTERILAEAYGVIGGLFFSRDTVLINPEGQVEKIWRTVDPTEDADRVLEYVLANPQ